MERISSSTWHSRQGVRLSKRSEPATPCASGDVEPKYQAAKEGAILVDRSSIGRVKAIGPDALDLLNRLSTNQLEGLSPGKGASTVLTTSKGRILDWLTVLCLEDHVLLLTSPGAAMVVSDWIDKYTIIEEVTLEDVTSQTEMLGVIGPKAVDLLDQLVGDKVRKLPRYHAFLTSWRGADLLVVRTDPVGLQGYDLIVPVSHAETLQDTLLEAGSRTGAVAIGEEDFELLRVEAGVPRYGHELNQSYNPLEAGLQDSISWTKGCYIGQEVIARLNTYHKVQRHLVTIALESRVAPPTGTHLRVEGKAAGVLTSTIHSFRQKGPLALGYLRTAYVKHGLQVEACLSDGRTVTGTVVRAPELPEVALTPGQLMSLAEEEFE